MDVTAATLVSARPTACAAVDIRLDDEQARLATRARAGDADAFGALVDVHCRAARRVALDTIRLQLTLEYRPSSAAAATETVLPTSTLNESLTVILQPGKPLTVSRAVDPLTSRRTSVDVTATIMK